MFAIDGPMLIQMDLDELELRENLRPLLTCALVEECAQRQLSNGSNNQGEYSGSNNFCSFFLPTTADYAENKVLKELSANLAALMVVKN